MNELQHDIWTMDDLEFQVVVSGPGLEMTKTINQQTALNVLSVVMTGDQSHNSEKVTQSRESRHEQPETTVGEYLANLTVRNNQDRIAGIALYLRDHLDEPRLPFDDIQAWFQRAGEPAPKNLTRDLNKAVRKKLVAEDHERPGEYFITSTGEKRVSGKEKTPKAQKVSTNKTQNSGNSTSANRKKRGATSSDHGPMEWIQSLMDGDFFTEFRSSADIVEELAKKGAHYKSSDLTRQLQALVQEGKLKREKKVPEGKSREVWHYMLS